MVSGRHWRLGYQGGVASTFVASRGHNVRMLQRAILSWFVALRLVGPAFAAASLDPVDRWQRVDFQSFAQPRNASEIRVVIQTNGPSMQGLIRIPGAALPPTSIPDQGGQLWI